MFESEDRIQELLVERHVGIHSIKSELTALEEVTSHERDDDCAALVKTMRLPQEHGSSGSSDTIKVGGRRSMGSLRLVRSAALLLTLTSFISGTAHATRYYVDDDAAPGGDGLSWMTAFDSLDDAMSALQPGDRIWLAEGTYHPTLEQTPGDPRSATFLFPGNTCLIGGFAGNEATLAERAGLFETTVLSGARGVPGPDENVRHVVTVLHPSGITPGINMIDGVRVREGNANDHHGGGIRAFNVGLHLLNVTIEDCFAFNGGGVNAQPGALFMQDCVLRRNRAQNNGGGLWGHAVNLKIFNTRFEDNSAGGKGGGIFAHSTLVAFEAMLLANCVFTDNRAQVGGGLFIGGGQLSYGIVSVKGCTFFANAATQRGGAVRANTDPALPARLFLHNSILWGNTARAGAGLSGRGVVTFNNLQDPSYAGKQGNFSQPPLFVNPKARDLRLQAGSPCLDAGAEAMMASDYLDIDLDGMWDEPVPFDFYGGRRAIDNVAPDTGLGSGPLPDMGAHERGPH